MNARKARAIGSMVRSWLSAAIVVGLAALGCWQWAWLVLAMFAFSELLGIGLVLSESLRSREQRS